jgi:hypothetical protein
LKSWRFGNNLCPDCLLRGNSFAGARKAIESIAESAKYPMGDLGPRLSSETVKMIRFGCMRPALAVAALFACAAPALADDTGVAGIHEQRREGGRTCFVDHYHYGSSAGLPSKKAAFAAGIKSWADFTDFEYGSDWARWSRASSKSAKCSQAGLGGSWSCDISARPCR